MVHGLVLPKSDTSTAPFIIGTNYSIKRHTEASHPEILQILQGKAKPDSFDFTQKIRQRMQLNNQQWLNFDQCLFGCGFRSESRDALRIHLILWHSECELAVAGFSRNYLKFEASILSAEDLVASIRSEKRSNPIVKKKPEILSKPDGNSFGEYLLNRHNE